MAEPEFDNFADVNARLKEILDAVSDDSIAFDDALLLYEEAVKLGLAASNLIEVDVEKDAEALAEAPEVPAATALETAAVPEATPAPALETPAALGSDSVSASGPSDPAPDNAVPEDARP